MTFPPVALRGGYERARLRRGGSIESGATLFRRCSSGEVQATLPQTVWQEYTHELMLAEVMTRGLILGGNPVLHFEL